MDMDDDMNNPNESKAPEFLASSEVVRIQQRLGGNYDSFKQLCVSGNLDGVKAILSSIGIKYKEHEFYLIIGQVSLDHAASKSLNAEIAILHEKLRGVECHIDQMKLEKQRIYSNTSNFCVALYQEIRVFEDDLGTLLSIVTSKDEDSGEKTKTKDSEEYEISLQTIQQEYDKTEDDSPERKQLEKKMKEEVQSFLDKLLTATFDGRLSIKQVNKYDRYFCGSSRIPDAAIVGSALCQERATPLNTFLILEAKIRGAKGTWTDAQVGEIYGYMIDYIQDTKEDIAFGALYSQFGIQFYMIEDNKRTTLHKSRFIRWNDSLFLGYINAISYAQRKAHTDYYNVMYEQLYQQFPKDYVSFIAKGATSFVFSFWEKNEEEEKQDKKTRKLWELRCVKYYWNNNQLGNNLFDRLVLNEVSMYKQLQESGFQHMLPILDTFTKNQKIYGIVLPYAKPIRTANERRYFAIKLTEIIKSLHVTQKMTHLDLRWPNVLQLDHPKRCVLIDFETMQPSFKDNVQDDIAGLNAMKTDSKYRVIPVEKPKGNK